MLVLAFVLTQGWSVREAECRSVQPAGIPKESKRPAFLEKQKTLGCTRINVGFCYCTCARFPESLLVSLFQSQLCLAEGKGGFDPTTADL